METLYAWGKFTQFFKKLTWAIEGQMEWRSHKLLDEYICMYILMNPKWICWIRLKVSTRAGGCHNHVVQLTIDAVSNHPLNKLGSNECSNMIGRSEWEVSDW